jgi:SnoaL-like domain
MTDDDEAGRVLRAFWERIDAQDWDAMADLLGPGFEASYLHTGEVFDADAMVRLNREYPGRWRVEIDDLVTSGERAVSRASIRGGDQTFHVASFATVRSGRVVDLVELWTDGVATPPEHRPTR